MGKDVQFPGGTTEHENAVTGLPRQVRVDMTKHTLRLHDGVKQGGHEIPSTEYITTLLATGQSGGSNVSNVIQMFNSVPELKAAQPSANIYAILRAAGIEDAFIWKSGAGDNGDIASDVSGHWHRLAKQINFAIGSWRAGLIPLQIGGSEPTEDQATTPWLSADVLKLWDGTDYLDATPTLWMKLFAAIGGFFTGSGSLPDRVAAQETEIANLNTVTESGWYKSKTDATGAPVAGVHSFEHREVSSAIALQIFFPHNNATRNYWVRYRTAVTPTWTSWIEVAGALPSRLASTSAASADANTMLETGMYTLSAAGANGPSALAAMIMVIRTSATVISQFAVESNGAMHRRVMAGGVWGAWLALSLFGHNHDDRYYTEDEADALLFGKSDKGHNHDERYYTESEVNAMIGPVPTVGNTASLKIVTGARAMANGAILAFSCIRAGAFRIVGDFLATSGTQMTFSRNGVVIGTRTGTSAWATLSVDATFAIGDLLEIEYTANSEQSLQTRNVQIRNAARSTGFAAAHALAPPY